MEVTKENTAELPVAEILSNKLFDKWKEEKKRADQFEQKCKTLEQEIGDLKTLLKKEQEITARLRESLEHAQKKLKNRQLYWVPA